MTTFGYKIGWLAFDSPSSPKDVAETLGLTGVRTATWSDGVTAAYRDGPEVLVTPRLLGADGRQWILVCGFDLLEADLDLVALSMQTGGEIHWYGTHRVVESHGWARVRAGELTRRFWTVGETGECGSFGDPDEFEASLGVPPTMTDHDALFDAVLGADIDEDTVMQVAGRWSVDPQSLDDTPGLTALIGVMPLPTP